MKPMMWYGLSLLVLLVAGVNGLSSCQSTLLGEDDPGLIDSDDYDPDAVVAVLEQVQGYVQKTGDDYDFFYVLDYVMETDSMKYCGRVVPGSPLAPGSEAIPESLRQEGLPVVFSGQVHPSPPGVRMDGSPFTLTYLALWEGPADYAGMKRFCSGGVVGDTRREP